MTGLESTTTTKRFTHDPERLLRSALLLIDHGDYRLAKNLLAEHLRQSPNSEQAIRWLGYCLEKSNDFEGARKCYQVMTRIAPSEESYFLLAKLENSMSHYFTAKDNFHWALRHSNPESANLFDIYRNLGNIYVREHDFDSAEDYYNKAFAIRNDSDSLNVNYGILEIQRSNWSDAGVRFRLALEKNSNNDGAWVGLALVHRNTVDSQLAWANLEKALDINSCNKVALQLCIEWGIADEMFELPIAKLQKYLMQNPSDIYMSMSLASLLYTVGADDLCDLEIEKILSYDPSCEQAVNLREKIRAKRVQEK